MRCTQRVRLMNPSEVAQIRSGCSGFTTCLPPAIYGRIRGGCGSIAGEENDMYQTKHNEFFASICKG